MYENDYFSYVFSIDHLYGSSDFAMLEKLPMQQTRFGSFIVILQSFL